MRFSTVARRVIFFALICPAGFSACAFAQSITGEINGTVTDSQGAVIPKATVTIVNSDTHETVRKLTTDGRGNYSAPLLQVGTYSVQVTAEGFNPRSIDGVSLSVSDQLEIDLKVVPAGTTVSVNVNAEADNLAPKLEDAAASTVISGQEVRELALNTRNFEQLVQLQPGVSFGGSSDQVYTGLVQPNGQSNNASQSINGLRSTQNAWLLDGADMLAHSTGQQVAIFPSIEAIQEIKVLRNSYGAQYGGGGSAQVQLITKAGGSAYHGDVYLFARNAIFNANTYFNNQIGQPRPQDNQYNSGFTIGGPLFIPHLYPKSRSHTYGFYSLDVQRDAVATEQSVTGAPTPLELQGIFPSNVCLAYANPASTTCTSQGTTITNINPVSAAYVKEVFAGFPAPNNPADPNGLILDQLGIHNGTQSIARVDHSFNQRFSMFFRYIDDPIFIVSPAGLYKTQGYPNMSTTNIATSAQSYMVHGTFALTSSTVLDGAFNYMPYGITSRPVGNFANAPLTQSLITLPFPSSFPQPPSVTIDNSIAYSVTGPVSDQNKTYQAYINVFHVFGRHSVSSGINFEHYTRVVNQGTLNGGNYNFVDNGPSGSGTTPFLQSFADFLEGHVATFQQNSIDPIARPQITLAEAYIQDDWKAAPRLTLNLGVRYSFYQQAKDAQSHLGSFAPPYFNPTLSPTIDSNGNICTASPCAGGAALNPLYNPATYNGVIIGGVNSPFGNAVSPQPVANVAPRVGFAYDVFGNGKTSLRAGYGIFYNQTQSDIVQMAVNSNPAYVQVATFTPTATIPITMSAPGANASNAPLAAAGLDSHWKTPYTQGYSLDVQQQMDRTTLLDIAYAGNESRHLIGELDINQPFPGEYIGTGDFYSSTATSNGVSCSKLPQNTPACNTVKSATTPYLNQIRPYKGYNAIVGEATVFTANYNALQTSINKTFGSVSRVTVNYTWSKGLTTNQYDENGAPQNSYDIPAEYGLVSYDRRHILTAHFVYELPFEKAQKGVKGHLEGGWEFSGIVSAVSGLPLTVTTGGVDPAGQGLLAPSTPEIARPDCVSDITPDPHTQALWFNTSDYSEVPATSNGRPGDCRNGSVRGPGYQVWNLDLFKNVVITERTHLQFRVETFNTFNHVSWTTVNTGIINKIFGEVTAARDPRQMQLGVKYIF